MKYVGDAPAGKTWFRLESDGEAEMESAAMGHAVAKHFLRAMDAARQSYVPASGASFEANIGLNAHLQRTMPLFVTLRDTDGKPHVTGMLPPGGKEDPRFRPIIVGRDNSDPYPDYADAIQALGAVYGLRLDRARCYPYGR
ncbi:MAG: hypothetical protein KDC18_00790 [Alphaproteobacteria bacterium]|nr:hypothetical protein [Alphaproteobacteria bacterium]MCB9931475.1 hypothetical protein [Alphaproteobacteria bacterium]